MFQFFLTIAFKVCSRSGFVGLDDITKLLGETFTTKRGTSNRGKVTKLGASYPGVMGRSREKSTQGMVGL